MEQQAGDQKKARNRGPQWRCTKTLRFALYSRDGFRCVYCGTDVTEMDGGRNYLTLDHLVCRSKGGAHHDPANIVTACNLCNGTRGCRPVEEFATGGALERIARLVAKPVNMQALKAANLDGSLGGDR